jgi:hypothetical protein
MHQALGLYIAASNQDVDVSKDGGAEGHVLVLDKPLYRNAGILSWCTPAFLLPFPPGEGWGEGLSGRCVTLLSADRAGCVPPRPPRCSTCV